MSLHTGRFWSSLMPSNRHGIAVLRYDKRGVGDSTGDFAAATSVDFASDVDAAVAFLNSRPEVDKHHIGLIGHSEGGAIAPPAAIANAVNDALRPLGVELMRSPITPHRVVEAVLAARAAERSAA